jgi:hypothetical protein
MMRKRFRIFQDFGKASKSWIQMGEYSEFVNMIPSRIIMPQSSWKSLKAKVKIS